MSIPTQTSRDEVRLRADIDRSLRYPVMFFFVSGAFWLVVSLLLGVISSLKLVAPGFLGECSGLQYGVSFPAHVNTLVYGWAAQVAFGVMIWMLARLSKQPSKNPMTILVAGHVWNIAVALGTLGILLGHGTGKDWMQFPSFVWPVLLGSYAAIVISSLVSFRTRRSGKHSTISQWYLLAAMLWFPWVYLTANLYVNVFSIDPLMAVAINAWFRSTFVFLFFMPVAIGAAYYLVSKVTGCPIYNHTYSLVGFWLLALIAPWTGMQAMMGVPIPIFLQFVGAGASMLVAIPLVLAGVNIIQTVDGKRGKRQMIEKSPTLRFTIAGVIALFALATITALFSYPTLLKLVQFTNAGYGLGMLAVYGVFSMVMFGAIYYIVPRLTLREWVSPHLIRLHFTFSLYGVVLIALAGTLVAGIQQGLLQENQDLSTIEVAMNSVSYSASMIIAWCLILLSNGFFVFHLFLMWLRRGKSSSRPTLLNDV